MSLMFIKSVAFIALMPLLACSENNFASSGTGTTQRASGTQPGTIKTTTAIPAGDSRDIGELPDAHAGAIEHAESSDPSIATVDDSGTIHGVKSGTTTVTVTYGDGTTAEIAVTVTDAGESVDADAETGEQAVVTDADVMTQASVDVMAASVDQAVQLCATQQAHLVNLEQTFVFDDPNVVCPWGSDDNEAMQNSFIRARIEQEAPLKLPPGALICSFAIAAPQQQIVYDDHILILLNDIVIGASKLTSGHYDVDGKLMLYSWQKLNGMQFSNENDVPTCLGEADGGICHFPKTETVGQFQVDVPDADAAELGFRVQKRTETSHMRLVSTGDNDPDIDCRHSRLELQIKARYLQP